MLHLPRRRLAACSALFALSLLGCSESPDAPPPAATPEAVVKSLYTWRLSSPMTGAPTPEQIEQMSPYISTELRELLSAARARHEQDRERAPTEKPDFAEGDLFTSLFEGATTFIANDAEQRGPEEHVVPVRFTSARQLPAVNWVDHVKVVKENGAWVVADVEYGNHWAFGNKGTLLDALKGKAPKRKA